MPAEILLILAVATGFQLSTTCSSETQFYDTGLLACNSCGTNKKASSDYLSCICEDGLAKTESTVNYVNFECSSCGSNQVPTYDQTDCVSCPNDLISDNECSCSADTYEFIEEYDEDSTLLETKECISCSSINTYTGEKSYSCKKCNDVNMQRDSSTYECYCDSTNYYTSQQACVSKELDIIVSYSPSAAANVTYTKFEIGSGIIQKDIAVSDTFNYYYAKAASDCSNNDVIGCQQLANLCVLQLYNQQKTACQLYNQIQTGRDLVSSKGQYKNMAWLYYIQDALTVLEDKNTVDMLVTFDPNSEDEKVNELAFTLAEFYLNGTFIGYKNLTDQLVLCPHEYTVGSKYRKFGTNVQVTCTLDLTSYITYSETTFFELYLFISNTSLIDIPVLVKNYKDADGGSPNESSDESKWKLVRKFFIYDNISGKEGTDAYVNGDKATVLQYMRTATLRVKLINDQDQKIYVPLLILDYRARYTTYIEKTDATDHIAFYSQYTMNLSRFWYIARGVFIGINVLVLIITLARTYIWTKNNPSEHVRDTYTSRLIIQSIWYLAGSWAFIIFWYLIGITAYWFIFYKMQYHVYALVPPLDTYETNYVPFVIVFAIVFASHFIWIIYIIKSQTSNDIIFIDREQPQDACKPGVDKITAAIFRDENNYRKYISAWRTLMIANEFAELQSCRYISIELTLFFLLFFLKGLSWEDLARAQPNMSVNETGSSLIPVNMVLRFFLTSFIFLIIAYVQLVIRKVMSTWFPTPVQNFVDLCVVSNISILILDDSLHGYYIHGVTPLPRADMSLEELHDGLGKGAIKGEANNDIKIYNHKKSLLAPDEEDLFTFEVYLPFEMRIKYDQIIQQANNDRDFNEKMFDYQKYEKTRFKLNESFKAFFDPEVRNLRSFVFEKSSLQRVLSMPPTEMGRYSGSAFFFKDPAMSFESVLFMGKEFSVILMDLLVFDLLDIAVGNSLVSALTTYLFSKAVSYLRYDLGETNIARRTMVDKRFII